MICNIEWFLVVRNFDHICVMGHVHRCDLHSPFITSWERKWLQGKERKRTLFKYTKRNKTEMNVLYYPMVYYANTIQFILTYTNVANRIQPRLWNEKKKKKTTTLCMCHGPGVYDVAVDVTWVPCPYLKK